MTLRTGGFENQNPVYPDDRFLTNDQIAAKMRAAALIRAQSPGERICHIDEFELAHGPPQDPTPHLKSHPYDEYMDFRFQQVVGPSDPWTPWLSFDQWAQIAGVPPPVPIPPPPLTGWNVRAAVNPRGIPYINRLDPGWGNHTWCTQIATTRISFGAGSKTRISIVARGHVGPTYIGVATGPFRTNALYQLTFNGGQPDALPVGPEYIVTTDPLPHGFDPGQNGLIISGYLYGPIPGEDTTYLGARTSERDYFGWFTTGNYASALNKLDTVQVTAGTILSYWSLAVISVEAFY